MPESTPSPSEPQGFASVPSRQEELGFALDEIRIEPLGKHHNRGAFVCTNDKIQNYCRNNARRNHENYMVRVFVACPKGSNDVLGYYYLALTSYKIQEDGDIHLDAASDQKFGRVESVPAVYLGMIGVHSDYQKLGIGRSLMIDAIQRTAKIAQHAGTYALALDALDDTLVAYYSQKFGFQTFKEGKGLEMFLPIRTILDSLPQE